MTGKIVSLDRYGRYGWEWIVERGGHQTYYRTHEDGTHLELWNVLTQCWQEVITHFHLPKVRQSAQEYLERMIVERPW